MVNLYFVLAQFHINRARFSLAFPTYVHLFTQIAVPFFKPFQPPIYLAHPEKSARMLSSSLSKIYQVINNL